MKFTPDMDAAGLAAAGRNEELRTLLAGDPELAHETDPDGLTALHIAASWNQAECAEALIEADADMNARASVALMRQNPGQTAVMHGSLDVLRTMLKHGFDPNTQFDPQIGSVLHLATLAKLDEVCRLLIEHGADEFAKDASGRTPREAAERRIRTVVAARDPLVTLLRANEATGAELDAYLDDHPERIDEVLELSTGPMTPLEVALVAGDRDRVEVVLKHRPSLTVCNLAALDRADELGKLLEENPGAAVLPNARGMKPVELATAFGARASLELLLDADPLTIGPSVLSRAVAQPDESIWRLLVERGADFAAAYAEEPRDFIAVVAFGNPAAIRFLIDQGIDVTLEHPTLGSMLDYARTFGKPEVVSLVEGAPSS